MKMSEHNHQVTLINWFETKYPQYTGHLIAIPNGGFRHAATAARLAREGVRAGVPDLHLPVAAGGFHGLWIELKSEAGRASPQQQAWISRLESLGHRAEVCRGWESAAALIDEYLS